MDMQNNTPQEVRSLRAEGNTREVDRKPIRSLRNNAGAYFDSGARGKNSLTNM